MRRSSIPPMPVGFTSSTERQRPVRFALKPAGTLVIARSTVNLPIPIGHTFCLYMPRAYFAQPAVVSDPTIPGLIRKLKSSEACNPLSTSRSMTSSSMW